MGKEYPLVEAIFEVRWGEASSNRFSYNSFCETEFFQRFAVTASKEGFDVYERATDDNNMLPHRVIHRYRQKDDTWPCLQVGLGVFTVNQIAESYNREDFIKSIEKGVAILLKSLGGEANRIKDTLMILLRYQNAFYDDGVSNELSKLEDYFGIKLQFPSSFENNLERVSNVELSFGLKCEKPTNSHANISIQNAIIEGKKGTFVDSVVWTHFKTLETKGIDTRDSIQKWIDDAYDFQKETYEQLMVS
ncbi:TIGR04255 family protein [Vibrio vulnificus]|uniref:TIGR04255 family protein n=1 Tax=Vibrio vulnificus TaxID=672 RepID=UPI001CDC46AD|nr:TIGR04255 family protein [Vibrio vulnificus]EKZ9200068.1 TIGR04255 family protein [Vibrio vulnificus]MCA3974467.1 TIGR04255 family protein [Vibrio vulnificus]HDY7666237.1 TIGR04255 family protein [Vibrio vulnificus]HDY7671589.1 TIGR04255 family protein [Vibrio vulnificus]HDY7853933.1 TIGR04255 family protein [Vibrio vulnificus]